MKSPAAFAIDASVATAFAGARRVPELAAGPHGAPDRVPVCAKAIRPGAYGEHSCQCQGILLGMQGGTGWIQPLQTIDHPSARWNKGHIYMSTQDMRCSATALRPRDIIVFFLYVDSKGLGAEDCYPLRDSANMKPHVPTSPTISFSASPGASQAGRGGWDWRPTNKSSYWDRTTSGWKDEANSRWGTRWSKEPPGPPKPWWRSLKDEEQAPSRWGSTFATGMVETNPVVCRFDLYASEDDEDDD
jgi:hypothetical protein